MDTVEIRCTTCGFLKAERKECLGCVASSIVDNGPRYVFWKAKERYRAKSAPV